MASKNGRDTLKKLEKRNKYLGSTYILKFLIIIVYYYYYLSEISILKER